MTLRGSVIHWVITIVSKTLTMTQLLPYIYMLWNYICCVFCIGGYSDGWYYICSHCYCIKLNTVVMVLHTNYSMNIYIIKSKLMITIWCASTTAVLQEQKVSEQRMNNSSNVKFEHFGQYMLTIITELMIQYHHVPSNGQHNKIKIFHSTIITEFNIAVSQYHHNIA